MTQKLRPAPTCNILACDILSWEFGSQFVPAPDRGLRFQSYLKANVKVTREKNTTHLTHTVDNMEEHIAYLLWSSAHNPLLHHSMQSTDSCALIIIMLFRCSICNCNDHSTIPLVARKLELPFELETSHLACEPETPDTPTVHNKLICLQNHEFTYLFRSI